eukprot:CAMPEP_0119571608 /NCGR_PEP_ID=MMETSP1352-20130426/44207_1 /TAXON_ID=265584 /ORGANISM="Stauroneis constricta, Strain CCMP1120" /LENGTH=530 /DNA_ID=CAMNT_0007621291 /DNA_START=273 /DNA_END=1865 /DNA_ORIENTATION=+
METSMQSTSSLSSSASSGAASCTSSLAQQLQSALAENNVGVQSMLREQNQTAMIHLSNSLAACEAILVLEQTGRSNSNSNRNRSNENSPRPAHQAAAAPSNGGAAVRDLPDGGQYRRQTQPRQNARTRMNGLHRNGSQFTCVPIGTRHLSRSTGRDTAAAATGMPPTASASHPTSSSSLEEHAFVDHHRNIPPSIEYSNRNESSNNMASASVSMLGRSSLNYLVLMNEDVVMHHFIHLYRHELRFLRIVSASVIWNLALLYHTRATQLLHEDPASPMHAVLLQKAKCMYNKVLRVIGSDERYNDLSAPALADHSNVAWASSTTTASTTPETSPAESPTSQTDQNAEMQSVGSMQTTSDVDSLKNAYHYASSNGNNSNSNNGDAGSSQSCAFDSTSTLTSVADESRPIQLKHMAWALRIATLNNVGQLFYDLNEDVPSQQTFAILSLLFTPIPQPPRAPPPPSASSTITVSSSVASDESTSTITATKIHEYVELVFGNGVVQQVWLNILVSIQLLLVTSTTTIQTGAAATA